MSAGVIGASEIGDKTFFIAAVMAMRNSRWTVRLFEQSVLKWPLGSSWQGPLARLGHNMCVGIQGARGLLCCCPPQIFAGALGALAAMTVLSALLGWAAPNLVGLAVF